MSADDGNGEASKPRDIPDYVQRNFKLHKSLGIAGAEKTTARHQAAPRSFLLDGLPGSGPEVVDGEAIDVAHKEASPAETTAEMALYRAYVNQQNSTPQTSSAAMAMYKAYTSKRDGTPTPSSTDSLSASHSFNGHHPLADQASEMGQKTLPMRTSADARNGNSVISKGEERDHTTQQPRSRQQQDADEVYQNTVVRYQERVRKGEEKVPTDQDRRNNRAWIADYREWMLRQRSERDLDEGFSKLQEPKKGG